VGQFCPPGSGSRSTDPIESGSNQDPDTDPDPQPCFSRNDNNFDEHSSWINDNFLKAQHENASAFPGSVIILIA
jgi:hypothetical protein